MIFSLDANVMIDIVNGRTDVRQRMDAAVETGGEIVACAVAIHEIIYGAMISRQPDKHLARIEALAADLKVIDWTHADGLAAAEIRRDLRKNGRTIGYYDLLIAGQALNRGWTVVSHNLREYARVDGLVTDDWTVAA